MRGSAFEGEIVSAIPNFGIDYANAKTND